MIGLDEIAKLAEVYDRYALALDRKNPGRSQARRQFFARRGELAVFPFG